MVTAKHIIGLLVVVAGIGGAFMYLPSFSGGVDTEASAPFDTVNVSTNTSESIASLPPGVTKQSVDETRLFNAHHTRVSDANYTAKRYIQYNSISGTSTSYHNITHTDTQSLYRMNGTSEYVLWTNYSVSYQRSTINGSTRTQKKGEYSEKYYGHHYILRSLLKAGDYQFNGTAVVNGETVAVLELQQITNMEAAKNAVNLDSSVKNLNTTLYVSSNGVIRRADYRGVGDGVKSITASGTAQYTGIGNVSVTKPVWVSENPNVVKMKVEPHAKKNYTTVTMTSGKILPSGLNLAVYGNPAKTQSTPLKTDLNPGDTIYITRKGDKLYFSVNEEPSVEGHEVREGLFVVREKADMSAEVYYQISITRYATGPHY